MKYKDKVINYQNRSIEKQLNSMLAYGIDGLSITPVPEETVGNEDIEDIEADKKNSRV